MARLDMVMVQQGMVPSRQRAKTLIQNGQISVNGKVCTKPAFAVSETDRIAMEGSDIPFVGRGGLKLEHAVQQMRLSLEPAVLPTACSSTEPQRYTLLTWDTDSWCSPCGRIPAW